MVIDPVVEDKIGQAVLVRCRADARIGEKTFDFRGEQQRAGERAVVERPGRHDVAGQRQLLTARIEQRERKVSVQVSGEAVAIFLIGREHQPGIRHSGTCVIEPRELFAIIEASVEADDGV